MPYRKFQASQLFTGTQLLDGNHVLVTDEQGKISGIVPREDAGEGVRELNGILLPGLINCHCHLELSHMKGLIPEKTGLIDFVVGVVSQRHFSEEDILAAIQLAEEEMIHGGIVAVGDICNNPLTIAQKQQQRLAYYNFIEVSGWLPDIAEARFSKAEEVRKAFEEGQNSKNQNVLVPHAPYSVSEQLWQLLAPCFPGKTITIHNQETAFEDELFISGKGGFSRMYELMRLDNSFFRPGGKSSLQSFFSRTGAAERLVLVHNTFTKEEDIIFVQNTSRPVSWCLCVNANLYIENALPPVELLRKHGCSLVIGTDSLASNHSLSVLDELKTLHTHFPGIPLQELLLWATLNGAAALQMDDTLGSFETGKTPGINLLQEVPDGKITSRTTISRLL